MVDCAELVKVDSRVIVELDASDELRETDLVDVCVTSAVLGCRVVVTVAY